MTPNGKRIRLRFIAVTCEEEFFAPVRRGMEDAARAMDVDAEFTGSRGVDAAEMSALADAALDLGCDGLAIDIFDAEAFRPVIARARAKGVPVVAFNINAGGGSAGNLAGIAQDFTAAGKALGRRAASHIAPGAAVLLTMHDAGISALEERRDGIKAGLAGHGIRWSELITGHHPHLAASAVAAALAAQPDIVAMLATGQADTEGMSIALRERALPLYAAGFDLSPAILAAIADGLIDCTVDQQPYGQGFYPVVQLALHIRHGLMPADIDAGAAIVERGNVARIQALAAAGYR